MIALAPRVHCGPGTCCGSSAHLHSEQLRLLIVREQRCVWQTFFGVLPSESKQTTKSNAESRRWASEPCSLRGELRQHGLQSFGPAVPRGSSTCTLEIQRPSTADAERGLLVLLQVQGRTKPPPEAQCTQDVPIRKLQKKSLQVMSCCSLSVFFHTPAERAGAGAPKWSW